MKTFLPTVTLTLLTLVFVSSEATAQGWGRGWGRNGGQGRGMGRGLGPGFRCASLASLNLSEKQRQQINELQVENDKKLAPFWRELESKQDELQTLWANPTQDRDRIVTLETETDALRAKIRRENLNFQSSVSSILNPGQRDRFTQCGRGLWGRGLGLGSDGGVGRGLGMGWGRRCRGGCGNGYGYGRRR